MVKVLAGANDPERCWQGFTVASLAVASQARVSLWLASEAVWLAVPGHAEEMTLPEAPPLADLRDLVLASGTITACTQCLARRDIHELLPGVRQAGAAAFVEEILQQGVQALTY